MSKLLTRRRVLIGLGLATPALAYGYTRMPRLSKVKKRLLKTGEQLSYQTRNLIGRNALAPEYAPEDMSPIFRTNGSTFPDSAEWQAHEKQGFVNWRLRVDGRVNTPREFSLAELKALPARTQITRLDCVEGWSAIGEWTGVKLGPLLQTVGLADDARFIVFWCADVIRGWQYYESIDLIDAFHPQTILAYGMNGGPLPTGHGAPIRLRAERQLGYKNAKFIMRIEAVTALEGVGHLGGGGFWEDASGYGWYGGI